jgi:hypothetical protein
VIGKSIAMAGEQIWLAKAAAKGMLDPMRTYMAGVLGMVLLHSSWPATAREAALRYKFLAGQTNVFAVEISVLSETGFQMDRGNITVVTMAANTNTATLLCRGELKSQTRPAPSRTPGFYPGVLPGGIPTLFPPDCQIELDGQGNEIRDGGDYVMAAPLGKLVQCLFTPLPENAGVIEACDLVAVLDEPFWLGPSESFLNPGPNAPPPGNAYPGQRNVPATLLAARRTGWELKAATPALAQLHRHATLASLAQTGGKPRLAATSDTDLTFDRATGMISQIAIQADISSETATSSRHAKVSFKSRRLAGEELAAALAPPPPVRENSQKLGGEELATVTADLRSPDAEQRRVAVLRLGDAELAATSPQLVSLMAPFAFSEDSAVRESVARFLNRHGTTNETLTLIRLLKDPEDGVVQTAARALARLQDERGIVPLTEVLAGGLRIKQSNPTQNLQFLPDIAAALQSFGSNAEEDVAALLDERGIETRRQACLILKQIGTADSLNALQKVIGDPDPEVNQAAADAIRAIKQRQ